MRVLAIDTALEACSVAVLDTESADASVHESLPMQRGHAEALMPLIARVLGRARLDFSGIDRIAVTTGPGSFTGLRVGLAAAQGLGIGWGVPVAGYSGNLQNNGERLRLVRPITSLLDEEVDAVRYSDRAPWPTNADGLGASLQLIDPTLERARVANWAAAAPTPGVRNSVFGTLTPFPPLWLNELLVFNTQGPTDNLGELEPWVEIFNRGAASASVGACAVSTLPT